MHLNNSKNISHCYDTVNKERELSGMLDSTNDNLFLIPGEKIKDYMSSLHGINLY